MILQKYRGKGAASNFYRKNTGGFEDPGVDIQVP